MMECLTNEIYEKGLEVINEVRNPKPSPSHFHLFLYLYFLVPSSIYFKIHQVNV